MRHTDPRAAYAARTTQTHAKLARLQQLAHDHFGHDLTPSTGTTLATWGGWSKHSTIRSPSSTAWATDGAAMGMLPKLTPTQGLLLRAAALRAAGGSQRGGDP